MDLKNARTLEVQRDVLETKCWEWQGCNQSGYGIGTFKGKRMATHRMFYQEIKGPLIKGLDVSHLCHNPICCNPAHLIQETRKENINRSVNDGRPVGNVTGQSRITESGRKKISDIHKGRLSPMKGRTHSDETKEKMKRNSKRISGKDHINFGKKLNPESIEKREETKRLNRLKKLN